MLFTFQKRLSFLSVTQCDTAILAPLRHTCIVAGPLQAPSTPSGSCRPSLLRQKPFTALMSLHSLRISHASRPMHTTTTRQTSFIFPATAEALQKTDAHSDTFARQYTTTIIHSSSAHSCRDSLHVLPSRPFASSLRVLIALTYTAVMTWTWIRRHRRTEKKVHHARRRRKQCVKATGFTIVESETFR
jgi:hypothetical protein